MITGPTIRAVLLKLRVMKAAILDIIMSDFKQDNFVRHGGSSVEMLPWARLRKL
jgi:hypothetical protein